MPGTQSIAQKETTSQKVNASNLRFRRDSGYGHKTYGSLEVISWYSQSLQQKKGSQTQNKHRIAKLTYNNLSLHNQALSQPLEANFQSNAAHTGPPWQCGKAALNVLNEQTAVTNCRTQNCNQLILRRWAPNGNAVLILLYLDVELTELETETCIGDPIVI